jgi:GNAT superfamily N-acetyltransferase
MGEIRIERGLEGVDWAAMTDDLIADDFDNLRTPAELARSFAASAHTALAWDGDVVVGTARALADGVCVAYLVDVWTRSSHRRRGVAALMVQDILARVPGHHVALFTTDAEKFWQAQGFARQEIGMSRVAGPWLNRYPPR